MSDMLETEISTRRFTKEFRSVRNRPLVVTDRGEILGTWTPASRKTPAINFEKRARQNSAKSMPITFAETLRERKKR